MLTTLLGLELALHLFTAQAFKENLEVTLAASAETYIAWTHIEVRPT